MAYWGEVEIIEHKIEEAHIAGNYSTVTANYYACSDTFAGWSGYATYPFCGIYFGSGKVEETKTLASFDFRSSKKILLGSITKDIPHEADGTKTIGASFTWDSNHSLVGTLTGSKEQVLTTIPRASKITAVDANIESATTININRASSNFTHTITYAFEGLSGTIATKTSDTSVGFQIPASFYAKIPNSKTGTVTLTCTTYNGDTVIGTSTTTFTVTASEEKCKPDISATLIDSNSATVALTGNSSKLIKYKSTAKITPTATAKNSATIKSIAVNGHVVSGSYIAFENAQSETFTVVATDSRGYTNTLELKPTVIQYIPLSATAKFDRLSATSSEVKVKYSGNYYNGSFGSADNALTISWAYKEKDAASWMTGGTLTPTIENNTFSGEASLGKIFNYKTAYDFILYVSDKLTKVSPQETVKKGETIFDYGVDEEGNNYFNANGEYYKNGVALLDIFYPVGSIYMSVNNTNPSTLIGGTWEVWGAGRVPVGVDTSQTEFETVEKIGGSKYMQEHYHDVRYSSTFGRGVTISHTGSGEDVLDITNWSWQKNDANNKGSGSNLYTNTEGSGNSGNLQPYITCYMWKRTA